MTAASLLLLFHLQPEPPDPTRSEQRELGGNHDWRKQLPVAGVVHARRWTGKASILLLLFIIPSKLLISVLFG
jgi:hypothetical protein